MAITEFQFRSMADTLQVEPALLKALNEVEAKGNGFQSDGRPKILFEGHIFWKELERRGVNPKEFVKGNEDILFQHRDKFKYKHGREEYDRLDKAIQIHNEAALCSASWGAFQIMGFNYAAAGYPNIYSFVEAMHRESEQLNAVGHFLVSNNLLRKMRSKDFKAIARAYNGDGFNQHQYDRKLERAFKKFKKMEEKMQKLEFSDSEGMNVLAK